MFANSAERLLLNVLNLDHPDAPQIQQLSISPKAYQAMVRAVELAGMLDAQRHRAAQFKRTKLQINSRI